MRYQTFVRSIILSISLTAHGVILVALSSFKNLRKITWRAPSSLNPSILQYAARQLNYTTSPCRIAEIVIILDLEDYERTQIKEICGNIDTTLTSYRFPLLRSFQIFKTIPSEYFPALKMRGILEATEWDLE